MSKTPFMGDIKVDAMFFFYYYLLETVSAQ